MEIFPLGCAVVVVNLEHARHLNLRPGKVGRATPRGDGRVAVRMLSDDKGYWIKPSNLQAVHDEAMFNALHKEGAFSDLSEADRLALGTQVLLASVSHPFPELTDSVAKTEL